MRLTRGLSFFADIVFATGSDPVHLAALTALADDRVLCLPQPDRNLTAT
jgi:hypothetical protein